MLFFSQPLLVLDICARQNLFLSNTCIIIKVCPFLTTLFNNRFCPFLTTAIFYSDISWEWHRKAEREWRKPPPRLTCACRKTRCSLFADHRCSGMYRWRIPTSDVLLRGKGFSDFLNPHRNLGMLWVDYFLPHECPFIENHKERCRYLRAS